MAKPTHWNTKLTEEKKATVARILNNPVYQPDSSMVVQLTRLLTSRLSLGDLRNLETIIAMKKKEG